MSFRFVYRTADISALSPSLDSLEMYISCSVHKCEWHSITIFRSASIVSSSTSAIPLEEEEEYYTHKEVLQDFVIASIYTYIWYCAVLPFYSILAMKTF